MKVAITVNKMTVTMFPEAFVVLNRRTVSHEARLAVFKARS